MAYEDITYEFLIDRMLKRVQETYPNIDTREGSILFNALAPAAIELALCYQELDNVLDESFVLTASRDYLILACYQLGIDVSKFEATFSTHRGEFNVEIEIGSRWSCGDYTYVTSEKLPSTNSYYAYELICETEGSEPNTITGTLSAISDLPSGLTHSELVSCITEGEDEKDDDYIREYYINYVNATESEGNVGQYELWASQFDGIGNYKVIPLWNGANTVKVSILSSSNRAASSDLITKFQNYLDPNTTGMGDGVAPIGAFVTVSTATEKPINVSCTITLENGYSSTPDIDGALTEYFAEIAYEKSQVNYMTIGSIILGVNGVEAINNLLVNNGTADINLGTEEIPVKGTTTWTVAN